MKTVLILLTFLLFAIPTFSQTEKPQTIIVPTGSLGDISESRKTEELAGFIEIADKSAPNAPNAPPIELNLEVPS